MGGERDHRPPDDAIVFGSREKAWPDDCWLLPDPEDPELWSDQMEEALFYGLPDHTQDALSAALRDRRSSKKARDAVGAALNKWRGLVARLFHLRFVEGEDACSKMFSHILIDSAGPAGFLSH